MRMKRRAKISFDNKRHAKALENPDYRAAYEKRRLIAEIGMEVRKMRAGAGLTQQQLANAIGSSQPTIARLERGLDQRVPRWDLLQRIAWAVGRQLKLSFGRAEEGSPLVEVAPPTPRPRARKRAHHGTAAGAAAK